MKSLLIGLFNRFKEPSSWAGIAAMIVSALPFLEGASQSITLIGAGAAGLLAFFLAEKAK